ncbi:hypothetical protein [Paralysiella testudinis]|uniref:Transposase n=1 Tax=Paralysiella testudinis TaxID=2809020 RepID=A0A892ZJ41_9NEIS|nr:hypothetical protein [Paralysiella testudinis]QRQ80929.1 hypothetical protein JQU52_09285 [Paralysiella testudinis]
MRLLIPTAPTSLHPTSLVKWRRRVGDKAEALLIETLRTAQESGAIQPSEFHHINVDTTVQEKNITFPTDAKLYHKARQVLVKAAQEHNIPLRQSYARSGKKAFILNNRYRHARQYKRANKACKTLKNYLGRIIRELERKGSQTDQALQSLLDRARLIYRQQTGDTNKIYSWHETAVHCIGKGKAHKKYEFGNCLVPEFYGVSLPQLKETDLWQAYCMVTPRLRLESEKKYKSLKRASQR